jgi:hypothetical protein
MNQLTAALAAQAILSLLEIYRTHTGKAADWVPTEADWDELEAWAETTPEQIKADALRRAGK